MKIPNQLFIDGEWTDASDGVRRPIVDPATEETIDSVPVASRADIDRALAAAARGFCAWREVDAWARSAALRRVAGWVRDRADTMARVLTDEQGKPLAEAKAEILATADQFDWYADEARRLYGRVVGGRSREQRLLVMRRPVGPVAAFSPWNFPALLSARKIAPALAAGCSLVVKPAEEAPRTTLLLAQACADAAIPKGAVNVVLGEPAMISGLVIASPIVRKVSLTGSVPVGREVARLCAEHLKPVELELGGHAPVIVFSDADPAAAAEACARAKFRNMGQVCASPSRFFVHEAIAAEFEERFVEVARLLRVGDGREPGTDVGPLANRRRVAAASALVADAAGKGARLRCGGGPPPGTARGFFFEPTVVTNVDDSMRIMTEEPFCPVAPIATFTSTEDVLARANRTDYGLAAYVFTNDTRTVFLVAEALEAGMVGVNHLAIAAAELPFGGVKASGWGREGGSEGIEAYTVCQSVSIRL